MAERALGIVVPGGSPKRLTFNEVDPTLPVRAQSYRLQHAPGNTAAAYVGSLNMDIGTGEGVYGFMPAPTDAEPQPYNSPDIAQLSTPHDLSQITVDSLSATDGYFVTIMV